MWQKVYRAEGKFVDKFKDWLDNFIILRQSRYKRKFTDDYVGKFDDANSYFTSLVPLRRISFDKITNAKTVVWKNPTHSSPRFCRPFRISNKNTAETVTEVDNVKEQVGKIVPFVVINPNR